MEGIGRMTTIAMEKVKNFIDSLELPKWIAESLFETVEEYQLFYIEYYGRNRYVIDDLLDYREYKIRNSQVTLELFLRECSFGGKRMSEIFKTTFFQTFSEEDMLLVERAVTDGHTTLETLFSDFKKNPNKNVLKNVL